MHIKSPPLSVSLLVLLALACSDDSTTDGTGSTLTQGSSSNTTSANAEASAGSSGTTTATNSNPADNTASATTTNETGTVSSPSQTAASGGAGGNSGAPDSGEGAGGSRGNATDPSTDAADDSTVPGSMSAGGAGGADSDPDESGEGAGGTQVDMTTDDMTTTDDAADDVTTADDGTDTEPAEGTPNPSPGCGTGERPDNGRVYQAGESWLVFPEKYDGNTPLPVLWGWHGCGEYNFGDANRTEYWDETRNSPFETEYVIAIPLAASGSCFDYNTDIVRTKALYDELTQNYCVDLDRMFGTGHSSGANFLHRMLEDSHRADWEYLGLAGIAPVASGPVNNQTSQVPTMYIHSPGESVSPEAPADNFRNANGCGMGSAPFEVEGCNSKHDRDPVNPSCIAYEDCDVTTIFCPHDDSNYDGTFHGIPCFFQQAAYDFFESL